MSQVNTPTIATKSAPGWRPDLRSPLVLGLIGLLAVQLLIALGSSLSRTTARALPPSTPLVTLSPEQVTRILIEGSDEGGKVQIDRKGDDQWVIADLADLPVTASKVDQLLTQVTALKRPLPIATTEEARKRFKVGDEGFERRLTLQDKDGKGITLILGETPGFRRIFGRPADDPAVYDLALALSDVSNRRDDWTETGLLKIDQEKIQSVTGKDWTLEKTKDGWSLKDSKEPLDQDAARDAVSKLASLGYRGVLGIQDEPAYNQAEPVLQLAIGLAEGKKQAYAISKLKDSDDYVLKASDRPYYFKLSKYDLEGVLDLDRAKLIAQPAQAESPPEAKPSESADSAAAATAPAEETAPPPAPEAAPAAAPPAPPAPAAAPEPPPAPAQ